MRFPPPIEQRLKEKLNIVSGCWEWTGQLSRDGYGLIRYQGKMQRVHRVSWEIASGQKPSLWILHKCDNRKCFNSDHLYEGTRSENAKDAVLRKRLHAQNITHCPKKHEYNKENTRMYQNRRYCRQCDRDRRPVWQS
jgi:hypothetical protein